MQDTKEREVDKAYARLLDMIVDLRLPPGAALNEQALAEQLSTGRTPVHEAVSRLAAEGFLLVFPRRGTTVAPLTLTGVLDIFEAREAVECGIAYLAASRASEDDLATLEGLSSAADEARDSADTERYLLADFQAQLFLVRLVPNSLLQGVGERLLLHNLRFWRYYFTTHSHSPNTMLTHGPLVAALRAKDADGAQNLMREHIEASRTMLRELF